MAIKFYNFLSRKKEVFKPIRKGNVNFYVCGPTVYNLVHIGNLRTYVFEDVLRRVLKFNGYKVKQIMNITDVEDKIIKKAEQEKKNIYQITRPYTKLFFDDLKKLNIEKAERYPLATKHIKEMVVLIKKMISKGFAYQSEDGSIYFNISKFKNYGKLSQLKKRELKMDARVNADEYNKEQAQDFVLWKSKKSNEPFWKSSFGDGRPGWHIECSAMSMKYLGKTFDIHCGAVDLIFPHHENEIAQSESVTGKKFVNYWIEGEHLLIDGQKMSKSLDNIYPLEELEKRGFNPLAFRYLILTSHYRSKLNFTWRSLQASANALNNLYNEITRINADKKPIYADKKSALIRRNQHQSAHKKEFLSIINDDLNTPQAIALIWRIIKDNKLSNTAKKQMILEFDKVLGLGYNLYTGRQSKIKLVKIPLKIKQLAEKREKLRTNKQFIPADLLRKQIEKLGYNIKDTLNGSEITPTRHRS